MELAAKHGIKNWQHICEDARSLARHYQCWKPDLVQNPMFRKKVGPYNVCFTLITFMDPPSYLGSVSVVEQIGWTSANLYGMGRNVEVPQDAMLAVESWSPEHFETARELLSDLFGPILKPGDDSQRVMETKGLMAFSWTVACTDAKIFKPKGVIVHA